LACGLPCEVEALRTLGPFKTSVRLRLSEFVMVLVGLMARERSRMFDIVKR
jgi:hypothetical protein